MPRRVCANTKTDYSKNRDSKKGEVKQETRVKADGYMTVTERIPQSSVNEEPGDDELAVAVRPRGKYLYVASY